MAIRLVFAQFDSLSQPRARGNGDEELVKKTAWLELPAMKLFSTVLNERGLGEEDVSAFAWVVHFLALSPCAREFLNREILAQSMRDRLLQSGADQATCARPSRPAREAI